MALIPQIDEVAGAVHGDCALIAPTASPSRTSPSSSAGAATRRSSKPPACPAAAISVIDEQIGQHVYP